MKKYGQVTYQMKGLETYHKMLANILPLHTLSTPGVRSNDQNIFFQKEVIFHIKLRGRFVMHIPWSSKPLVGSGGGFL